MQSKLNIFESLRHGSDSEEEDTQANKQKKVTEKKEQRARHEEKPKANTNRQAANPDSKVKEEHARTKGPQKAKGVTEEPHPLDRHSGHKNQAYGEKSKKSGAGKGNWGNFRDDKRANEEVREGETAQDNTEAKPQEVEDKSLTLTEYLQQQKRVQQEPQVNEAKAKITSEQLTKELGTATALKSRNQQQVDDRKAGKKKDRLDINHHAAINSEHADLLGFRTGFIEKEYKQRGPEEEGGQRRYAPRSAGLNKERENAKEEEAQPQAAEGQTTEAQPAEGEGQQAQEGAVTAEGQGQGRAQGQGQDNQNRRNEGGYRGGRGGYRGDRNQGNRPQGDRPQGDRYQGDRNQGDRYQGDRNQGDRYQGDRNQGDRNQGDRPRKQYGDKAQGKIPVVDESAFPKLG